MSCPRPRTCTCEEVPLPWSPYVDWMKSRELLKAQSLLWLVPENGRNVGRSGLGDGKDWLTGNEGGRLKAPRRLVLSYKVARSCILPTTCMNVEAYPSPAASEGGRLRAAGTSHAVRQYICVVLLHWVCGTLFHSNRKLSRGRCSPQRGACPGSCPETRLQTLTFNLWPPCWQCEALFI